MKYAALKNQMKYVKPDDPLFAKITSYISSTQIEGNPTIVVKKLFSLHREEEESVFRSSLHNNKLLFHGSNGV